MKQILIALILLTNTALAKEEDILNEMCLILERVATSIMQQRQNEFSMSKIMEITKKVENGWLKENITRIVLNAYEVDPYSSDEYKKKVVNMFKNKVYLECIKSFKK